MSAPRNALAAETSPYLLQHADNPVHWYPWGEAALERARAEDKPILLSIGYSACHWCHVMAHESFEDAATAARMNRDFINIKVDREERPDLDKTYQLAHQLLTQRSGGWPLTIFMTPDDHRPFFAGTYFPKEARAAMPTFTELLEGISNYYHSNRTELREQNARLATAFERLAEVSPCTPETLTKAPIAAARDRLREMFDRVSGGFGKAPKFPHPTNLDFLLRSYAHSVTDSAQHREPDEDALAMVMMTVMAMGNGGMNDQLAGGFCRYSVDNHWMIPHFEKMLYDNGPLLSTCVDLFQVCSAPDLARFANETAAWVMRDMQAPEGGYYASLDADSEGEEGRFYVWQTEAVAELLSAHEYAVLAPHFGLDRAANFERKAWHLHVYEPVADRQRPVLDAARAKLLAARNARVWPVRDDKILVSWNALMIKGMSRAGGVLGDAALLDSAERAVNFIREHMWIERRLVAVYKDGRAHLPAYLDDYALLLEALLCLLERRWRRTHLDFAIALADALLEHFEDPDKGGFFFTAHDHETLIFRSRSTMDEAMPAGGAVATLALQRLGHLLGEMRYLQSSERAITAAWSALEQTPHAHATMLRALDEFLNRPQTIVIRADACCIEQWQQCALRNYAPRRQVFAIARDDSEQDEPLPGLLRHRIAPSTPATALAYVCSGYHCDAPVATLADFETLLAATEVPERSISIAPSKPI
jgi:uncharacterized protein